MSENGQESPRKPLYYGELNHMYNYPLGMDTTIRDGAERRRQFDPDGKKALELAKKFH